MKTIHLDENKNPFLPNRQMVRFCRKNVMTISSYPTIDNADIINEISSVFNIEKEFVSFGNGYLLQTGVIFRGRSLWSTNSDFLGI